MDLHSALTAHSQKIDQTISDFFDIQEDEASAIDVHLVQSIQLLRTFTLRGGKSIRSFLSKIAYELAQGNENSSLYKALASVELHHKHILILDDISDRDEFRYGGPTLEYAYRDVMKGLPDSDHRAMSFAMLDGVFLGSLSKEILSQADFPPSTRLAVTHLFNTILFRDTLAGWQIHGMQCVQTLSEANQQEFIKGLELVTASYTFEGPLKIGLTLAENKDKSLENALTVYAKEVGTAFQIHDDILGLFGDSAKTGKPVGNDVREGKKTLLLQVAYERASSEEKAVLDSACGQPISTDMLRNVQAIVNATGSHDYSVKLEKEYVDRGITALEQLPKSDAKQHLIDLAHYIITREK